ncbi:MAG: S8 family peptidase [Muribaculaceae bacterium]|nr:S8 family peptidase [Muribaculaceae bacterium]
MRIILSLLFFLPILLEGVSAGHISPELKARLTRVESITSLFSDTESEEYIPVIMRLTDEQSAEELESMGVIIWHTRDDLALGAVPRSIVHDVVGSRWIREISSSQASVPSMNRASQWVGLDKIRDRIDLDKVYDCEGVVVGFSDIGYDPSHISFMNGDGTHRTVRLSHYDGISGTCQKCESPSEVAAWTTDNVEKYHATHVCGILAGSAADSPYNGVAQKAEIVATTSNLYDPEILAGVEDVVRYAQSVGKPAVVNLSLSSAMGPHDGTQLFNEYIDKLGEEALITVSAGNSATSPVVVSKTFSVDDTSMGTAFMEEWVWRGYNVNGAFDVWSDNDEELLTELLVIDDNTSQIISRIKIDGEESVIISHEYAVDYPRGTVDPGFDSLFTGIIIVYREVNPHNNRYNVYVDLSYSPRKEQTSHGWAESWIGLEVTGSPGTRVDGYASSGIHLSKKTPTMLAGSGVGSINDIATAANVISVGAYSTCNSVVQSDGSSFGYPEYNVGQIAYFSSYGTLVDGRKLPLVSAPGAVVVSAVSSPYLENGGSFSPLVESRDYEGKTYCWGAEAGTSMSAPLVAGGLALWLQADPMLSVDDVKRILLETSPLPHDAVEPGWGGGMFNMYAGLKMVRKESGLDNVMDPMKPVVTRSGDMLTVTSVEDLPLCCSLTAMNGSVVISQTGVQSVELSLAGVPKGVYILNVSQGDKVCGVIKIIR